MKNHIIISLLILSVGLSQQEYHSNDLVQMDNGLWTIKFSDEPISGKVYGYFGEKRPYKKVYIGKIVYGKKEGKWVDYYHSTGKKKYEENWKDGKEDGLWTSWYENGQKKGEGIFKDGKLDGLVTQWYKNGQKSGEGTYKDGEWISSKTWNEDGSVKE